MDSMLDDSVGEFRCALLIGGLDDESRSSDGKSKRRVQFVDGNHIPIVQ
jgi:hypothetical protein